MSKKKIDPAISRSWMLVNGAKPELFDAAAKSKADQIILDVEDAVDPKLKPQALADVIAWLEAGNKAWVRINDFTTSFWVADVAAYFAGHAFGRRKLALHISPGKSWEGVWGGMLGVLLMAFGWVWADTQWEMDSPSLYSLLNAKGPAYLVLATVFLVAMSVVGDLIESLVKRSAGMKDSSQLLPGHGGVLDRVDALLPTLPLALMLIAWPT